MSSPFEQPFSAGKFASPQGDGLSLLALNQSTGETPQGLTPGHANSSQAADSASTQLDPTAWTYLVNLTANMLPDNEAGSGYKYNQLMKLKDATEHSNSEVIVQAFDPKTYTVQRYEIAHGQIHVFNPVKTAGTMQDLQNLIAAAPKGGHLALINEAHGNGDIGFDGDAGKYSVSQFGQAIKNGLAATGHTSLDLLSMDSCLMSNVQVLATLSGLAKNVVASELEEFSSTEVSASPPITQYDMQPIDEYLAAMLKQPPQNGADAASQLLATSAKSCDALAQKNGACGTPTLGIYNPEAAPGAQRALDKFGEQMQLAIKDPRIRKNVDRQIGQLPDVSVAGDHLRDVDDFAESVINQINNGAIKDGNHSLKLAAEDVLKADKNLVRSFYVNNNTKIVSLKGHPPLHGLNTYLPGSELNIRSEAEDLIGNDAKTRPLQDLLNLEIHTSLPDADSGGWAGFVKALRS